MGEILCIYSLAVMASLPWHGAELWWKIFGFCGNGVFATRFLLQWIHSERHGESRIPVSFWWLSLVGTIMLLIYFIHIKDPVGILGYAVNAVPYTRNLMLIRRKKLREQALSDGK